MFDIIVDKFGDYFSGISLPTFLLIFLFIIILLVIFVAKNWKGFRGIWDYFYKKKRSHEEMREQLNKVLELTEGFGKQLNEVANQVSNNTERLNDIEKRTNDNMERMSTYEENRIHDREQSFEKQRTIDHGFELVNDSISNLLSTLHEMQEKDDAKERANLKDRISRLYRECHEAGKWTKMQKETMEDMIDSYELCGGENSFCHSVVQKEMYTWEVIDEDD